MFLADSGHGGQTKDLDGDEDDGEDEVIYPVDFQQAGHIVDDLIHDIVVKPLPPGCRLTAIFDSCHSGSALDLPYIYSTEGKLKEPNLAAEAGQGLLSAISAYSRGDMISWSGCKDSQTSADAFEAGKAAGAMSFAFMSALKAKPEQSYQELLINIR
ncbi:hypothetical protein EUX98_g994 [Antrodiella citrinella]|uniref:Peptidase C14 caspase domain-containing protein n=1 Tax=Antrodiella citrinella TaxID=2447956 RepID=A0A4S4N2P2_9APHY|nr:hypothetical protein EUX98_g994 [Antrodiella citrinella]